MKLLENSSPRKLLEIYRSTRKFCMYTITSAILFYMAASKNNRLLIDTNYLFKKTIFYSRLRFE
ncbi:hypothetical protein SCA6_017621 [Theobroma cacao]